MNHISSAGYGGRIGDTRNVESLIPGQVKPLTYQIYFCRFLASCLAVKLHGPMKYIFLKTKICIYIQFYVPNLDIGALTSSLGQHIHNNQ